VSIRLNCLPVLKERVCKEVEEWAVLVLCGQRWPRVLATYVPFVHRMSFRYCETRVEHAAHRADKPLISHVLASLAPSIFREMRHCTLVFLPARLRSELSAEAQAHKADVLRRRGLPRALVWQLPIPTRPPAENTKVVVH
jgi:hypothetical protein